MSGFVKKAQCESSTYTGMDQSRRIWAMLSVEILYHEQFYSRYGIHLSTETSCHMSSGILGLCGFNELEVLVWL